MSARARDKRGSGAGGRSGGARGKAAAEAAEPPAGVEFKPPLKPHRGVFVLLCIVLAVWVGVLLVMYFKTVYPQRHGGATKGFSLRAGASPRASMEADFR